MIENTSVAIQRCYSYSPDELYPVLLEICNASDMPDVADKTVLLKPNILSDADASECITTHPNVVAVLIRILKEKGCHDILVGDSPGIQSHNFCGKQCGIYDVCINEGARWIDFTEHFRMVRLPGTNQNVPITESVFDSDVIISVSKFKTHQLMYTTGSVKNLFGTVPSVHKSKCHLTNPSRESFARLIASIHEAVKPSFTVMDAVIGMEGHGPANGRPRAVNLIISSKSCIAADIAQALIMGYDPYDIPVIAEFKRRRLIPQSITFPVLNPKDLVLNDFDIIPIRKRTELFSSLVLPFLSRSIQKKRRRQEKAPSFDNDKCIRCSKCVRICPAGALTLKDRVIIDETKCIRCFCCHEMCPKNAILIGDNDV